MSADAPRGSSGRPPTPHGAAARFARGCGTSTTWPSPLVFDEVFDRALERIRAAGIPFSAGPGRTPGEINFNHGGRGVYFDDPSGHHFELITQPYGADL